MKKQKENSLHIKNKTKSKRSFLKKFFGLKIKTKIFIFLTALLLIGFGVFYAIIYPELYSLHEIYVINQENQLFEVGPKDPIKIKFSRAVKKENVENSFSISPYTEGKISWQDELSLGYAQTFIFTPQDYFEPDMIYRFNFSELESFYGTRKEEANYSFKTITSPQIKKVSSEEEIAKKIKPEIEIELNKNNSYFDFTFEFNPVAEFNIEYDNDKNSYKITPLNNLAFDTEYDLKINKYFNAENSVLNKSKTPEPGSVLINSFGYTFKSVSAVAIEDIFPEDNSNNNRQYGEIRIAFDRQVDYQSAEDNFSITPEIEGNIGWEEKTLVFEPELFQPNTEYQVEIKKGIKAYQDDGYLPEDFVFNFKTEINPKEIIPNVLIEPQITEGKYIDVDISEQILTMFEDGKSLGSYLASTGKYSMPTPYGQFQIMNKSELAYSNKYDLYMPFWMQFTSAGHGIHELPFWKYRGGAEYKEREAHLGTRISHGCVRLGVGPAERVYRWADIGTPIYVHE